MTSYGQIPEPVASLPGICPQDLDNSASYPQFHSHDDDDLYQYEGVPLPKVRKNLDTTVVWHARAHPGTCFDNQSRRIDLKLQ